jgi:hypothetical protein
MLSVLYIQPFSLMGFVLREMLTRFTRIAPDVKVRAYLFCLPIFTPQHLMNLEAFRLIL